MTPIERVQHLSDLHERGVVTSHDVVYLILQSMGEMGSEAEIFTVIESLPDQLQAQLSHEMKLLADADYYVLSCHIGDQRSLAQVHQDAQSLQPIYRRVCEHLQALGFPKASSSD